MTDSSSGNPSFPIKMRLRHGKKLCPNCLGPLKPATFISGWLVPEEYLCEACGYVGHVSLEASNNQEAPATGKDDSKGLGA
ncbi:MAG: hypothetical protein HYU39_00915 [Thaumarchaeota archaeon]|nr:hypothetical protein [Nitrososphaerota archaeon]